MSSSTSSVKLSLLCPHPWSENKQESLSNLVCSSRVWSNSKRILLLCCGNLCGTTYILVLMSPLWKHSLFLILHLQNFLNQHAHHLTTNLIWTKYLYNYSSPPIEHYWTLRGGEAINTHRSLENAFWRIGRVGSTKSCARVARDFHTTLIKFYLLESPTDAKEYLSCL